MKNEGIDNETILVSLVLVDEPSLIEAAQIVSSSDFANQHAGAVFQAALDLLKAGEEVSAVAVFNALVGNKSAQSWLVREGMSGIAMHGSAESIAQYISESARKRRVLSALKKIQTDLSSPSCPSADFTLAEMSRLYQQEIGGGKKDAGTVAVSQRFSVVRAENAAAGGTLGLDPGFKSLSADEIRYVPGHLWVIGGWTSVGKTTWQIECIKRLYSEQAKRGSVVAAYSTEMTEEQIYARLVANISNIPARAILSGKRLLDNDEKFVGKIDEYLKSIPLYIVDYMRELSDIEASCRKIAMKHGKVDVVFIDFVQNLTKKGAKSKYEMLAEIAIDLQCLARSLRCCIICLSQLPNQAAKEDSGILEFKGAGELAAAADIGALLKRGNTDDRLLMFDVRKNRHGKVGKHIFRFRDDWAGIIEGEHDAK